ncbi:class D sortase [Cohnella suwonensis]|uniref:Class D sortase n=1 Tax=Cohnella suwonensis TaxID=696072 RepID=A0ABW0LRH8_9BACL
MGRTNPNGGNPILRKAPYALILLGLALLSYPYLREKYDDHRQNELLRKLERPTSTAGAPVTPLAVEYERLSGLLGQQPPEDETVPSPPPAIDKQTEGALGVLTIEGIDVELPILEGATKANMKYASAHMTETAAIGQPGNAAIAAHRARTKGRLFNRLNEVKVGDRIRIDAGDRSYEYDVFRIKVVEPTDLSVLENEGDLAMLTLITCDPLVNPTHRLIVQAKLVS